MTSTARASEEEFRSANAMQSTVAAPSTAPPTAPKRFDPSVDLVTAADALFEALFPLLDRDGSGWASEEDVIAALICMVGTEERARVALARVTESGHVDQRCLRELIEAQMPPQTGENGAQWHVRLVRIVIAIIRDFEKRAIDRGDFVASAEGREVARHVREMEQRRAFATLEALKREQHGGLRRGQVAEARQFNKEWTVRMAEFNNHARRAVAELRARHEAAVEAFVAEHRPQMHDQFKRTHHALETLDAKFTLTRLTLAEEFTEANKYAKRVQQLTRRDAEEAATLSELALQKKLDVLRWQQNLELRGLLAKVARLLEGGHGDPPAYPLPCMQFLTTAPRPSFTGREAALGAPGRLGGGAVAAGAESAKHAAGARCQTEGRFKARC